MPAKKAAPKVRRGGCVAITRAGPCRRMLHEAGDGPSRLSAAYFGWIFTRRRWIGVLRVHRHEHPRVGGKGDALARTFVLEHALVPTGGLGCFSCHLEGFADLVVGGWMIESPKCHMLRQARDATPGRASPWVRTRGAARCNARLHVRSCYAGPYVSFCHE
jgi:hypothetical protein